MGCSFRNTCGGKVCIIVIAIACFERLVNGNGYAMVIVTASFGMIRMVVVMVMFVMAEVI